MKMMIMIMKMKMKMKMAMKQWVKTEKNEIKGKSDILDKIIDQSKSFEEQIKLLKRREDLKRFLPCKNFGDKELKSKYLNLEFADTSNETDKKLFEQIFGHTLYDKLYEMVLLMIGWSNQGINVLM